MAGDYREVLRMLGVTVEPWQERVMRDLWSAPEVEMRPSRDREMHAYLRMVANDVRRPVIQAEFGQPTNSDN